VIIITGERLYGKVDRVPGSFYVATMFWYLNYLPLIPLRSYIVLEGTESGGQFRGKQIPVDGRSALVGYVRAWGGLAITICAVIALLGLAGWVQGLGLGVLATLGCLAAGVCGLVSLFVGGKVGTGFQFAAHALSGVLWYVFDDAARANPGPAKEVLDFFLPALGLANAGLFLYGMFRLFDRASPERAERLLRELTDDLPDAPTGAEHGPAPARDATPWNRGKNRDTDW
jgi:hypothetical protein